MSSSRVILALAGAAATAGGLLVMHIRRLRGRVTDLQARVDKIDQQIETSHIEEEFVEARLSELEALKIAQSIGRCRDCRQSDRLCDYGFCCACGKNRDEEAVEPAVKAVRATQFCIVHELVESPCDCPAELAQAKELITTNECMGVPFLVRMGNAPEGIDPNDQDGIYLQTWRRTYDKDALGGIGSWRNELIKFERNPASTH